MDNLEPGEMDLCDLLISQVQLPRKVVTYTIFWAPKLRDWLTMNIWISGCRAQGWGHAHTITTHMHCKNVVAFWLPLVGWLINWLMDFYERREEKRKWEKKAESTSSYFQCPLWTPLHIYMNTPVCKTQREIRATPLWNLENNFYLLCAQISKAYKSRCLIGTQNVNTDEINEWIINLGKKKSVGRGVTQQGPEIGNFYREEW